MNEEAVKQALFEQGLDCFVLIGFDISGDEFRCYQAVTTAQEKALRAAWEDWSNEELECYFEPDEEFWQEDDD